jgi:osmotically-inducible protein OsmY
MIPYRFRAPVILAAYLLLTASALGQLQTDRKKQIQAQLSSLTPPETAFDDITFTLSGNNVTLRGFTNLPARAKDSERAVRSLPWVANVVNEIEVTSLTGSDEQIRSAALSILMNLIPRAFPQPWPDIRIKVHYGQVALYGLIEPNEEYRLQAAIRQIEARPFVRSVENHITIR